MKIKKKLLSVLLSAVMMFSAAAGVNFCFHSTAYAKAISAEDMARKFNELKAKYPEGSTWNGSYKNLSWQCMGWAETVCDYLFGENPRGWVQQTNWNNLCVGDHVRLYGWGDSDGHSIVITDMVGDKVYYADCNANFDARVHWGKSMSKSKLISDAVWFKSQNDNWVRTLSGAGSSQPAQSSGEEVYHFACAAGGRYLNVYAGNDSDGVNVCVWDADGSPEQKFRADSRGGGKYAFYPKSSNGRVLDANRGNSYDNPLRAGNNIDLWRTNDAPAQEWYLCDRGGGRYSIELASNRNLVISCDNPNANNGNCSLQNYNGSDNQLWYVKRSGGGSVNLQIQSAPAPVQEPQPTPAPEPTPTPTPEATPEPTPTPTPTPEMTPEPTPTPTPEPEFTPEPPQDNTNNQIILQIGQTRATVFGRTVYNDVAPILRNNRTMLPARFVAESLGAMVEWDESLQLVTITNSSTTILIFVGSDKAYVNGKAQILDSPAFTQNDRTYTPVRFIVEALDCSVDWDGATEKIIITKR